MRMVQTLYRFQPARFPNFDKESRKLDNTWNSCVNLSQINRNICALDCNRTPPTIVTILSCAETNLAKNNWIHRLTRRSVSFSSQNYHPSLQFQRLEMEARVGNKAEKGGNNLSTTPNINRDTSNFPQGCSGLSCSQYVGTALNPFNQAYSIIFLEAGGSSSELEGLQLSHG